MDSETVNIMDKVTLEYMTNPHYNFTQKKNGIQSSTEEERQFFLDRKFYKKRILSLTRDMFKKNNYPNHLNDIHKQYVALIIEHIKMVDREDILQEEYAGINLEENISDKIFCNLDEANKEIFNIKPQVPTLDKYVKITKTTTEKKIIPKKKDIDLKQPGLKIKGLRPKKNKKNI